MTHNISNC